MIVLGNGFDVALGIDTKYSQFYGKSQELRDYAKNGNSLCEHILVNIKDGFWSDLESGLYHYSLAITDKYGEGDKVQAMKFEREFNELRAALFVYLEKVAGKPVAVDEQVAVLGLNIEWHKLGPQYLTFNYSINTANTASMNGRYILNGDDTIKEEHFVYQHGSIYDMHECHNHRPEDIVVGIDPYVQPVEEAHSFLYKTHQSLHDLNTTLHYINSKRFYVIYGCSVGDSDATYFRAIFNENQKGKVFLIYGYGADAIKSIKGNIERICGVRIADLVKENCVLFLDVKDVDKTRQKTKAVIDRYLAGQL